LPGGPRPAILERWRAPVAISFTVETDGRLSTGMSLGEAIEACDAGTEGYAAYYMVNCAHPTHFRDVLSGGDGTVTSTPVAFRTIAG
jgi:S-methylmethionine-dependent homocysteine/selenocysteine methylase